MAIVDPRRLIPFLEDLEDDLKRTQFTVQDVAVWHESLGKSPDEICAEYNLTLAEVHAALAYYFDHRAEIDQRLAEGEAFAEAMRKAMPAVTPEVKIGG